MWLNRCKSLEFLVSLESFLAWSIAEGYTISRLVVGYIFTYSWLISYLPVLPHDVGGSNGLFLDLFDYFWLFFVYLIADLPFWMLFSLA